MAERPVFVASPDRPELVKEIFFPLKWAPGFAAVQKEKNIKALHEAATAAGIANVLEVSSKSEKERGRHLSAFHLKVQVPTLGQVPLECVFQGSKVFENGGPYTDLYTKEARVAKKDPRLKESGALVAFEYAGERWPLEPKTAFYDWLYASAIFPHREWARKLRSYGGFSDIEFNPFRSINCQARSIALFLSLLDRGVLENVLASPDAFLDFLRNSSYRPQLRDHEISDDGSVSYDEIGIWSEVKLAIIKDYASAYARILDATQRKTASSLKWLYIDAFAGPGIHLSKTSGEVVDGSPLIALGTQPAFSEYHFIDADPTRARQLRSITGPRKDVHIYSEDCNDVLLRDVFPKVKFENYRRALCLLDPYNINLKWEVIETAGKMGTVEVFLNFMIMDINRNALRRNPDKAVQSKIDQLTRLWGDETWKEAAYDTAGNLFGNPEKVSNERFERAWRDRLKTKAGFKYVSEPMPMKTRTNSVIYYLYFASQRPVAADIVSDIFNKYAKRQGL